MRCKFNSFDLDNVRYSLSKYERRLDDVISKLREERDKMRNCSSERVEIGMKEEEMHRIEYDIKRLEEDLADAEKRKNDNYWVTVPRRNIDGTIQGYMQIPNYSLIEKMDEIIASAKEDLPPLKKKANKLFYEIKALKAMIKKREEVSGYFDSTINSVEGERAAVEAKIDEIHSLLSRVEDRAERIASVCIVDGKYPKKIRLID